jgi:hypothetical protein
MPTLPSLSLPEEEEEEISKPICPLIIPFWTVKPLRTVLPRLSAIQIEAHVVNGMRGDHQFFNLTVNPSDDYDRFLQKCGEMHCGRNVIRSHSDFKFSKK